MYCYSNWSTTRPSRYWINLVWNSTGYKTSSNIKMLWMRWINLLVVTVLTKCFRCGVRGVVITWTQEGMLCCRCRNELFPKYTRKYPGSCGQVNVPGHQDHNCKTCKYNPGCPENCRYVDCYGGNVCHYKNDWFFFNEYKFYYTYYI